MAYTSCICMVYVEVSFIKIPEFPQATVRLEAIADNPNPI